VLVCDWQ
jgi:hypothetical protein